MTSVRTDTELERNTRKETAPVAGVSLPRLYLLRSAISS